jgi:hypothetical protein
VLTYLEFQTVAKPSRFFKMGRVFKVLWTEPAGAATAADPEKSLFLSQVGFGQMSFTKFRRFIVVRERLHSCLCLPIYTYGGQGAAKPGVRPQNHAVVFVEGGPRPVPAPNEMPGKEAVPIILENQKETLEPMSRIDFSRVYTVEHNLRVLKIGRISPNHLASFDNAFVESTFGPKSNSSASHSLPVHNNSADDNVYNIYMYSPVQRLWWPCRAGFDSRLDRNLISSNMVTAMGLTANTDFATTQCVSFTGLNFTFNSHVQVIWENAYSAQSCLSTFSVVDGLTVDVFFDSEFQSGEAPVLIQPPARKGHQEFEAISNVGMGTGTFQLLESRLGDLAKDTIQTPFKTAHIITGDNEEVYNRFSLMDYTFFHVGRVFITLWSDPRKNNFDISDTSTSITFNTQNGRVSSQIRRFVVVRQGNRSCTCLPITSYNGTGSSEKGIDLGEHCAIYSSRRPRPILGMYKGALRVNLSSSGQEIVEGSMVDLGSVYTLETSSRVIDVGDLDSGSKILLLTYFKDVFFGVNETAQFKRDTEADHGKAFSPDFQLEDPASTSFASSPATLHYHPFPSDASANYSDYYPSQPPESYYNCLPEQRPPVGTPRTTVTSKLSISAQPFTPFQSTEGVPSINPIVVKKSPLNTLLSVDSNRNPAAPLPENNSLSIRSRGFPQKQKSQKS